MPTRSALAAAGVAPSASNAYVATVHVFAQSGGRRDESPVVATEFVTLGSSDLSFQRTLKLTAVAVALGTTITFSTDATLTRALLHGTVAADDAGTSLDRAAAAAGDGGAAELEALTAAVEAEPVEDGMSHPSEEILRRYLQAFGSGALPAWLRQSQRYPARFATFARLLGRQKLVRTEARIEILRSGLAAANVEVRDAVAQAAESWEDPALAPILRAHRETVSWLADYVAEVATELEG